MYWYLCCNMENNDPFVHFPKYFLYGHCYFCVYLHTYSCCIDVRRAFDQPRTATDGQTGWFVNCWHLALNSLTSAADAISTTVFVFHFIHKIDFVVMNDYTRFYFHTDKKFTFKKSVSTKCWKITIKNRGK